MNRSSINCQVGRACCATHGLQIISLTTLIVRHKRSAAHVSASTSYFCCNALLGRYSICIYVFPALQFADIYQSTAIMTKLWIVGQVHSNYQLNHINNFVWPFLFVYYIVVVTFVVFVFWLYCFIKLKMCLQAFLFLLTLLRAFVPLWLKSFNERLEVE